MFEGESRERRIPDRVLILRLLRYILPYRRRLAIVLLAITVTSITGVLGPYILGKEVIAKYIATGDIAGLQFIGLIYIGLILLSVLFDGVRRYIIGLIGQDMLFKMRSEMFSHLQRLSLSFFERSKSGDIVSRLTNDTDTIGEAFISGVISVISDIMNLAMIIIFMLSMNVQLTLVSMLVIPLLVGVTRLFHTKFKEAYRATRLKISKVTSTLEESVSGIREIQAFSREREAMREFREANLENLRANLQATKIWGIFSPTIMLIRAIGSSIVIIYGGMLAFSGALGPIETAAGIIIAFLLYNQMFFGPILDLTNFYNMVQSALAAAERIFELMDTPPEVKDRPGAVDLPPVKGEIKFENVTFGYDPKHPVIHNVSFKVKPGETIALVGPTGSGKSTIIKLLSRFYEPQSGVIKIDGYDIRYVTQSSLRRQMGIVLQENFLFNDTIMENIRYGKIGATDEEVIRAAKIVGAHEFIMSLPQGYNTKVGERGSNLSVGQRQLVALARALLRDPPILILDEATSSIDPYTELLIKRALNILLKDRTSIVIAHRLSTVRNADRILVIDDGRIVEEGTHRELIMKEGGLYRHLYEMQFREPAVPLAEHG
ncbi:ABC transporter ATP-binding protein [Candidatus Bathyarchaeota archaeon]|nr:MAG: ABC transporter ATP-binding protein [Candidatus Bathyarchaeota archaeon]